MEKIIETKICRCGKHFDITDKDIEFYEKVSLVFAGIKYSMPTPALCPDCRLQRRLSFRNERRLYKRNCDATGKEIISIYSPDKPHKVYNQHDWWSDKWEPKDYSRDFDFSRDFFSQWGELFMDVPELNLINFNVENSEYVNFLNDSKDCYLVFGSGFLEECLYSNWLFNSKNCIDNSNCIRGENGYMNVHLEDFYDCRYCYNCKSVSFCNHCAECNNCQSCVGCVGLNSKKYHIFNKGYAPEDYNAILSRLKEKDIISNYRELLKKHPFKSNNYINSFDCIGDFINNSKDCRDCYSIDDCENCRFAIDIIKGKDFYDANKSGYGEISYETLGGGYYNRVAMISFCAEISDSYYCHACFSSKNLFGCVGLRNSEYCILNKQYTKDEYEKLVPKIIEQMNKTGEWGEFFPSNISAFGYNESIAFESFPLSKDAALSKGFKWSDYEAPFPKVEKVIPADKLPTEISEIPDDILNWAIECEISKKPFRIIKQELDFYRKHGLPIPRYHPDQRHSDRMNLKNPCKLWDRECMKCGVDIKTTYSPDREEIVYCEKCYNKEII